jgi:hypothetical protein
VDEQPRRQQEQDRQRREQHERDAPECLGLEVAELLLAQGARGLIDAAL